MDHTDIPIVFRSMYIPKYFIFINMCYCMRIICMLKCNMFMAESVARVSVNSLLFCICINLQLYKYVCILR